MSEGTAPPPPPDNPYGGGGQAPPPPPPPPNQPPPGSSGGYGAPGQPQPGGYEAAPPPPHAAGGRRPGELLDRFLARLVDSVILIVVGIIINSVIIAAIFSTGGAGGMGFGGEVGAYSVVSSILTALIYLGYFTFMESSQGKTVGKMVMKLHVEGSNGGKPTLEEAAKRNIWMALPILGIIPILGIVAGIAQLVAVIMIAVGINNDPVGRRPWTDKFADTHVIKEG